MLLVILACTAKNLDSQAAPDGLLDQGALNPFPNSELDVTALPELPYVTTPWETERLGWRTGFSQAQVSVARLWHLGEIDPLSLNGQDAIGTGGAVRLVNLSTGDEIPCFAELDAYPDAISSGERTLIVRPMLAMPVGARVAVVLTDAVKLSSGASFPRDAWDRAVATLPVYTELSDILTGLGYDPVLAWDFVIGDGTAPVRALAADVGIPSAWTFDDVRTVDTPDDGAVPDGTWKAAEGSFTSTNYLVDDVAFELGSDFMPVAQGEGEMVLYVHVSEGARSAEPGTVPVILFGHGILSAPDRYLADSDDPSGVVALADRLGAIVVATVWRGLTYDDLVHAVAVSGDFGRFHELTDMLSQGVVNTLALERLVIEGGLLDDPIFEGRADRENVAWYGISLGSIEGAVVLANQTAIDHAVLHVGGSAWSTMLERSSNWPAFEQGIARTVPDPADRQLLYSVMQLYWDPVDPISYIDDLRDKTLLFQEAIGDNQVPNLSTETLMRSLDVPLGLPAATSPYGITTVDLPYAGTVFTQYDPMLGMPDAVNRPAEDTGAHNVPRLWPGCETQTATALTTGESVHACGTTVCSAENVGE